MSGSDLPVISRWTDVVAAATATKTFGQYRIGAPGASLSSHAMASCDDDEHLLKRRAARLLVSGPRLAFAETRAQAIANELIDAFEHRGTARYHEEFARLLPVRLMLEILGLSAEATPRFVEWFGNDEGDPARVLSARDLQREAGRREEAAAYLQSELLARFSTPRGDVLSEWIVELADHDPRLVIDYLVGEMSFLFFAGSLPVARMLTTALVTVLGDAAVRHRVESEPATFALVVEETLRLDPPVPSLNRRTRRDTEIDGTLVPSGSLVELAWHAANRDPDRFVRPDDLDLDRPALASLSFGRGPHQCLGAALARMQGRVALETLFARVTDIRLASPPEAPPARVEITFTRPRSIFRPDVRIFDTTQLDLVGSGGGIERRARRRVGE